jgi:hypothetical protein
MNQTSRASNLARLAAVLAAGVALVTTIDFASAKGHHDGSRHHYEDQDHSANKSNGVRPHFVISGQPANVKYVQREHHRKHKGDKYADSKGGKKKGCEKIIVPTAECGVSAKDPAGNTRPQLPPTKTTDNNKVTVSNGVNMADLSNTPTGLIVSSDKPGTITVFNGSTSQTFSGGSVTLHGAAVASGALNVQTPGLQAVKLANGDVSIAIKPEASGSSPPPAQPGNGETRDHRNNTVYLTGDSIKTTGSDSIKIPKGTIVARDHRGGKDPGVKLIKNDDGSYTAKAIDENKGFLGSLADAGNWVLDKLPPYGFTSKPVENTSVSVQQ